MKASYAILFGALLPILVAGCQQQDMNDLKQFVATAHQGKKPEVPPLPQIKPVETFTYGATNKPDPFNVRNLRPTRVLALPTGTGPDQNRRREPLEEFPLDALKMVGTLFREGERRVIVKTPQGQVLTAQVGNYLGQNYGQITSISEGEVKVREQVLNTAGVWVQRDASLRVIR